MIYWQGINIGNWQFYEEIVNIKSANFFSEANSPNITPANKSSCTVYSIHVFIFYLVTRLLHVHVTYFDFNVVLATPSIQTKPT